MTREEHLKWAKTRALEYLNSGDTFNAFASMCSDINKHSGLRNHSGLQLGMMLKIGGKLNTPHEMREWIVGFN